jgi:hypothetical protein
VHGDVLDEPDETFTLKLRAAVNAVLSDAQATATIVEDDDRPPTMRIASVTPDPRSAPVDSIQIVFSEPVIGLDMSDLTLTRDGGTNLLTASQLFESADGGTTWVLRDLAPITRTAGRYTLALVATGSGITDADGNALAAGDADSWRMYASVAGRRVFYNNSFFDGGSPAADAADDAAVAPDKRALRPGESAGSANVTGYSRGLNGIMVDFAGLPTGASLTAADFVFETGNGAAAAGWRPAPAPAAIIVRRGGGAGGSDRVAVTFADNAIRNTWLRVTVLANSRTGLQTPDVFSFGNLVGNAIDRAGSLGAIPAFRVDAWDLLATRRRPVPDIAPVPLTSPADQNRDGKIDSLDAAIVRMNLSRTLSAGFAASAPPLTRRLDVDAAILA